MQEIADAVRARHGVDPLGSATLRARFEQALAEIPEPVEAAGDPARVAWLDAIAGRLRVGETRFYRDGPQLEALARAVLDRALGAGRCRVLSAGCSTGEEAFTVAMMLADLAPKDAEWDVSGIDVRAASIEHARRARYPASTSASLPPRLRRFLVDRGDSVEIAPAVARRVRFNLGDLLTTPVVGPYDAILCRNVLIYLEEEAAVRVVARLARALTREGALLVARAEVPIVRRVPGLVATTPSTDVVLFQQAAMGLPSSAKMRAVPVMNEEPSPPSRVRLVVRPGDRAADIAARGQALFGRGAAIVEITIVGRWDDARAAETAPALRRLAAAARALGGRLQPSDDATARVLAAL
ncbi:MAG: hypothetical protein HYV09_01560 [Deltaproteobacteria bacterium]|nr:hypothetical protein [Deltaproteobacteria bacterium]